MAAYRPYRYEIRGDEIVRLPLNIEEPGSSSNSWPVPPHMSAKPFLSQSNPSIRARPHRFKVTTMKDILDPIEGPKSMDHLHFLLDCFVVSSGSDRPHLGRYLPNSDPDDFANTTQSPVIRNLLSKPDSIWSIPPPPDRPGPSRLPSSLLQDTTHYTFQSYYRPNLDRPEARHEFYGYDYFSPEDTITRELSEMRGVLERMLENHEEMNWATPYGLRDVLNMLPERASSEESPPFPVGEWVYELCGVCYDTRWLFRRACCSFTACGECLQKYFTAKVNDGQVQIECCNTECKAFIHRDEISARLVPKDKEKFQKLLVLANQDSNTKTCPRCSHLTKSPKKSSKLKKDKKSPNVTCPSCSLEWCFKCHAPAHVTLNCKQFQRGDRLLRSWAKERSHGQLNAQKCPKCKIFIQRSAGCDHMHCSRCNTDFCYKCGERYRYLKFFGDHYSKFSIFGCKYRFKKDHPIQRKMIRGAIFGGKLIAAPVLGLLALCAGALAVGISLFALPVYSGVQLYRHCEGRQNTKIVRRHPPTYHIPNLNLHLSNSYP